MRAVSGRPCAPAGARQQRTRMHDLHGQSSVAETASNLKMTPGIGGGNHSRTCAAEMSDLPLQKRVGLCWLGERVNAGAAAAPGGFGQFDERYVWQKPEE